MGRAGKMQIELPFFKRTLHKPETDGAVPWLFLLPSLVFVSAIILVPFADAVRRSFFSAMGREFVAFRNYVAVVNNSAFRLAALNTAKFVLVCIPILMAFSLMLALTLNAVKERRGWFKTAFLIPMSIPVASMVLLWKITFHENGLLNFLLRGINAEPVNWIGSGWAFGVLVFTYIWKNAGYNMVLLTAGISGINPALYESASMDGAGGIRQFIRITMPGLVPTLFTVTVLSMLNSFKVFREAYLIAGSYPNDSIYMLQHIFNNWFLSLDVDKMCAGAVLTAIVVMIPIMLLQRVLR